ncbi:NAD(P)-binding oxidoreductase [Furfurilactobacillus entadae]|uniref:NAD(P)-binding oxidoreductase n=1 Tax=Furfurilactobacillus entadae TaxID=2922307 RepID=UPI0035EE8D2F
MSTTFFVGAHGQIGQLAIQDFADAGEHVIAGIRDDRQAADFPTSEFVTTTPFDLNAFPEEMAVQFKTSGADTVVFSAGSGGKTGDDQTLMIDLDGAIKTMLAAQQAGIKRYIMVSSIYSNHREVWADTPIHPYLIAKHYADVFLEHTDLDYTILRFGTLINEPSTGQLVVNPTPEKGTKITRADAAKTILAVLQAPQTRRQDYTIGNGTTPLADAFK